MSTHQQPASPSVETLAAVIALESVKGFGPQKFREIHDAGLTAADVIADPERLPIKGKRGEDFKDELSKLDAKAKETAHARASRQMERAREHGAHILLHGDPCYPPNVWASNNPVPVLYVLGDLKHLADRKAVACVGSRAIAGAYADRQAEFAAFAAEGGWVVVSGFALGADTIAHRAARDAGGRTVCVMPCGLDRPFPPENKGLWHEFIRYPGAVMVSEFPFGTAAASLTLRKRNKLIIAAALGVLVGQSAKDGGAMNAYRFGVEQRKPVATFAHDGTDRTSGNRLITEGDGNEGHRGAKGDPAAGPERASRHRAAATRDPRGTAFPVESPDHRSWKAWLESLSSSI